MASDSQNEQCKPRCPYNCPYSPSNEDREEVEDVVDESDIEESDAFDKDMTIIRESDYQADVHFKKIWDTKFGPKVGITSKKEYSYVFDELDWDETHHKWSSERTEDTNMWEADLSAVMYISFYFAREGIDVTIDERVRKNYLLQMENLPLVYEQDKDNAN